MVDAYPQRIVCLAAEAPEILYRLGALERVVAVSGFTRSPEAARSLPKVGGFSDPNLDKIMALEPDLAITTSDVQADTAAALIRRGIPVLALHPRRLDDVWRTIMLLGAAVGRNALAEILVKELQGELEAIRAALPQDEHPRVYFEEWHDPLITGIGWISDLITLLGGEDIFRENVARAKAEGRVVQAAEVCRRLPDLIVASWCGKKADLDAIRRRPGWEATPAVQNGRVVEIPSRYILQTGPSLIEGARRLAAVLYPSAALEEN